MRTFIALLFTLISLQGHSKILLKTEAQVQGHVITSREVKVHELLSDVLGGPLENFKFDSGLEQIIKEWLLFYEAKAFYSSMVPKALVEKELVKVRRKFKKSLDKLSVQPQELRDKVMRRLEADRLYIFKKKASVLPVSLSEVETEYTQNRIRYGQLSFEEAKNKIRQNRIKENLQKRLEGWFRVLEKKYKAQRFTGYER